MPENKPKRTPWSPEPWRTTQREDGDWSIRGIDGHRIALVYDREDARLIAATPKLADVLEAAPDFGLPPAVFERRYCEWLEQARAVLAEALGETEGA